MRRRAATGDVDVLEPPTELLGPVVEAFCTAAEIAAHSFAPGCRGDHGPYRPGPNDGHLCVARLEHLTRQRWRAERERWLAKHRVPRETQCRVWPSRRATWHDAPHFSI